jgi:sucrose-phosphate synthase
MGQAVKKEFMHILFFNPQGNFDQDDSHLTEHQDFGGQLVYVKEVAMAMADAGHSVDIVTRRIIDAEWPEFSESLDSYDGYESKLRIIRIPCGGDLFLPKEQLWDHLPEFVDRTLEFYKGVFPDFVTAHYADGGYSAVLMEAATGLRFTFTGHSLAAQKLDKLGMEVANAEDMEERFQFSRRIAAERETMERAYRIITSTRQERMEQYGHDLYKGAVDVSDDSKFAVIPPGVNTKVFSTDEGVEDAELEKRLQASLHYPDHPHMLVASRVDEKKNIGNALQAWVENPALHEHTCFALCIRGLDDPWADIGGLTLEEQELLQPMLDMISEAGLKERVAFLNLQSQAELAAAYRYFAHRKSLFLLPSVYEPFGLAPIEAAACGLACVATKNGGPSEIFEDGSGILVDPFDIADIALGMQEALDRQPELSQRGRERVLEMYTWKKTAARYLAVIREGVRRDPADYIAVPEPDASDRIDTYLDEAGS